MNSAVRIVNPLPQALSYYCLQLVETFQRLGVDVEVPVVSPVERGVVNSAPGMLAGAIRNVSANRNGPTLQTWPSLGLVERLLWSSRDMVVFHDPVPIRHQFGYGSLAGRVARAWPGRLGATIVVHSKDAETASRSLFPSARVALAFHPIRSSAQGLDKPILSRPRVLVAGQFKPTRDVALLEALGQLLRARGLEASIVGRGWPDVPGWSVRSEFVSEDQMVEEILQAAVVLVPYSRYYQSGIAIRSLELGTPVALATNSFASHLLGDAPGLFDSGRGAGGALDAVVSAIDAQNPRAVLAQYRSAVDASWSDLLAGRHDA